MEVIDRGKDPMHVSVENRVPLILVPILIQQFAADFKGATMVQTWKLFLLTYKLFERETFLLTFIGTTEYFNTRNVTA